MNVSPIRIFDTLRGMQQAEALKAALELGVFTAIAKGSNTVKALAGACRASERGIRILADYLTIDGFLTKTADGVYGLSPDAATFLVAGAPAYLGNAVPFLMHETQRRAMETLAEAVRKGGTALEGQGSVSDSHPAWVDFAKGMMPMMMPAAQKIADLVANSGSLKVLDIAAGHGLFGIMIAQRNPAAQIYALDWPKVLEVAQQHAAQFGVEAGRYHLVSGNAFEIEYGSDYDVVLLTNFLHHFDHATNVDLLRKVHKALKPGGKAVILEFVPNDDRVTPPEAAGFALTMLAATPSGDAYTFRELDAMCREAGFQPAAVHDAPPSPEKIVIATKG
ncbi:MAG: class I SAM-dependent methyltransferase [Acidobacteria bacterium]|nr:class I SAM-dependent methyltransferase [Acidobacteriota bacterium]